MRKGAIMAKGKSTRKITYFPTFNGWLLLVVVV